jgi:hypothetical protein
MHATALQHTPPGDPLIGTTVAFDTYHSVVPCCISAVQMANKAKGTGTQQCHNCSKPYRTDIDIDVCTFCAQLCADLLSQGATVHN